MRRDVNIQGLIKDYLDNTLTAQEIQSKYDVSGWFMFNVLKKNNVPKKLNISGLTTDNLDKKMVIGLYETGMNPTNIAKQLGCSAVIISKLLSRCSVLKPPPFSTQKLSPDTVRCRFKERDIEMIGEYVDRNKLIAVKCMSIDCGYEWSALRTAKGCPKCADQRLTDAIIDERIADKPLIRIGSYVNSITPLEFHCTDDVCGNNWFAAPATVCPAFTSKRKGTGCPKCNGKHPLTDAIIDERLKGTGIKRVGNYINAKTPLTFQCERETCQHIWDGKPSTVSKGIRGCPQCPLGKNERMVGQILQEHGIYFESQRLLRAVIEDEPSRICLDFYLPRHNTIIEYNGRQHYETRRFGHETQEEIEQALIERQKRDQHLQDICDQHNIRLLWIDGRQFNGNKLRQHLIDIILPLLLQAA